MTGVEPKYMGIAPVAAVPKVLAETGLTKEDVDVFEVLHVQLSTLILLLTPD